MASDPPPSSPDLDGEPQADDLLAEQVEESPRSGAADGEEQPTETTSWGARVVCWAKRGVLAALVLAAAGMLTIYLTLRHYEQDLPSTDELKHYDPPQVTRVLARDGSLLAELFVQRRTVVSIVDIPKTMKVAVLAAEDADFYQHEGLDYLGMLRALIVNLRTASARQGGSTITQQVVKNVLLTPERTFERKARELLLARRIEQELSKDEILELYLNHIYFGHGRYGVEEAAHYYFGKSVREVSLAEAALLAGLAKGPSLYSPRVNISRARGRRDAVLEQIALKGFASRDLVDQSKGAAIVLAPASEKLAELAPEVVSEVKRLLRRLVGPAAARGGFTITTTIDPQLQAAARKAVRDNLDAYAKRHGLIGPLEKGKGKRRKSKRKKLVPFQGTPKSTGHHVYTAVVTGANGGVLEIRVGTAEGTVLMSEARRYNPKGLPPHRFAPKGTLLRVSPVVERNVGSDGVPHAYRLELGPQSALVAIDVKTREVLALVGSYEATRGGLDRATSAHRQPGSTFKPFVYSYGIHSRRLTPASIIAPSPTGRRPGDGAPLLLRPALARSVNAAASWALRELGAESVAAWAQAVGIHSKLGATASLALGAYELTPRELAGAYSTLAGAGIYQQPLLIRSIVGPDGKNVTLPALPPARQVLEEAEAYVVTSLLTSVIRSGTGRRARSLGLPLAGKTGTSNDAKDAWFAGYSPAIVCVTWTGYDDAIGLGSREAGSTAALPAFISFMRAAHRNRKVKPWPQPSGVRRVRIDPQTGLLAYPGQEDAISEIFVAGTEPSETAEPPDAGIEDAAADADVDADVEVDASSPDATAAQPDKTIDGGSAGPPEPSPTPSPPTAAPSAQPPPF